jgi:tRNA A37 threonylcarbamoyladenosine modification protein TsaB
MAAVSSFAAAAYEAAPDGSGSGVTAVVGPARRDHYFLGIFGSQGGWRPPIEDLSLELLAARVTGQAARIVTIGEPPEPISKVFPGVISQVRIAVGILGLVEKLGAEWSRGPEELSRLAPEYGQKVAAKTIAERSGG